MLATFRPLTTGLHQPMMYNLLRMRHCYPWLLVMGGTFRTSLLGFWFPCLASFSRLLWSTSFARFLCGVWFWASTFLELQYNSTVSVDVVRVKSYADSLFYKKGLPTRVTRTQCGYCPVVFVCLETAEVRVSESYATFIFGLNPFMNAFSRFFHVHFAAFIRNL